MTHDLDQLRAVLHDRAALAPSPDDLLPRTRQLVHRRQVRRRVGLVAGVVAVTALALVGTGMVGDLLPRDRTAVQPSRPLPPPGLPFSVGSVPTGYWLNSWYISDDGTAGVQYATGQTSEVFDVTSQRFDPAETVQLSPRTTTTVHGLPAVFGVAPDNATRQLSWQAGPGTWIDITEPVLATDNLSTIANSISPLPTTLPSALRIAVPDNLVVTIWQGILEPATQDVDVTLCPPHTPPTGADPPLECVEVHMGTGAAPKNPFQGPRPLMSADSKPVAVTGHPVITDDGKVVTRQVDSTHWVAVKSVSASPALVLRLAMAATAG